MDFDYTELYNILDDNGITYEQNKKNRDVAIKIILELKKRKAIKYNGIEVEDEDIVNRYLCYGMGGVREMFNRNQSYLYQTEFVYSILFHHYKKEWKIVENLIIEKIRNNGTN